jgi:hypothetical protein
MAIPRELVARPVSLPLSADTCSFYMVYLEVHKAAYILCSDVTWISN